MALNPEMGAPAGASPDPYDEADRLYRRHRETIGTEDEDFWRQLYSDHLNKHFPGHLEKATATPISRNPEVGQPVGANGGDGTSDGGFLGWLQSFLSNLGGGGGTNQGTSQQPPLNVPLIDPNAQVGPPNPTTPQAAQTSGGVATDSSGIDASNAANTSFGGGGMGGGSNPAGSALGAIGSGLSNIGKNISNTKSSYNAPNLPLPQKATFVPPNLTPNRNVSY